MRTKPGDPRAGKPYRDLWRLVDGAVRDTLNCHPDYLTSKGKFKDTARRSLTKRIVGTVLGFASQAGGSPGHHVPERGRGEGSSGG